MVVTIVFAAACSDGEPVMEPTEGTVAVTTTTLSVEDTGMVIDLPPIPTPPAPIPACRIVIDMTRDREIPYNCKLEIE